MEKIDWQKKGEGHRGRLRERFLARGLEAFTDAEVLELLLTLGTPRRDCKEPARGLLKRFGSFAATLDASRAELEQVKGVGPKNAFAMHFVQEVARRYLAQRVQGKEYLRSSREVGEYLIHAMRGLKREVFMVILLDAGHGILDTRILAKGTLTTNTIHSRELIKLGLEHHAAAVVVAHNHPSGALTPSEADRSLTRNLFLALAFAGMQLLDHLIVGAGDTTFSFADHGLMEDIRQKCLPIVTGA